MKNLFLFCTVGLLVSCSSLENHNETKKDFAVIHQFKKDALQLYFVPLGNGSSFITDIDTELLVVSGKGFRKVLGKSTGRYPYLNTYKLYKHTALNKLRNSLLTDVRDVRDTSPEEIITGPVIDIKEFKGENIDIKLRISYYQVPLEKKYDESDLKLKRQTLKKSFKIPLVIDAKTAQELKQEQKKQPPTNPKP